MKFSGFYNILLTIIITFLCFSTLNLLGEYNPIMYLAKELEFVKDLFGK